MGLRRGRPLARASAGPRRAPAQFVPRPAPRKRRGERVIVHGTYQAIPEPGHPADGQVREVSVDVATYEAARAELYGQVREGERLTGIRVEGRANEHR